MARPPVFPLEQKLRIVLSVLSGEMTVPEAARRLGSLRRRCGAPAEVAP